LPFVAVFQYNQYSLVFVVICSRIYYSKEMVVQISLELISLTGNLYAKYYGDNHR